MSLGAGSRLCLKNLGLQRTLGPSPTGQPGMANKPALQHPGCRDPTQSVLSLALPRQVATHGGGGAQSPGQKGFQAGPPQDGSCCQRGRGSGKEAATSSTFLDGEPQAPFFPVQRSAPSRHRALQGRAGPARVTARVQGKSHDCSVLLQVSQLLQAAWGSGGEEEGGVRGGK